MNLVMDEVEELLRDPSTGEWTDKTRPLGLAVLRGTALTVINPADGFEQIAKYVFYIWKRVYFCLADLSRTSSQSLRSSRVTKSAAYMGQNLQK